MNVFFIIWIFCQHLTGTFLFIIRADLMERDMLPVVEEYYNDKKFNNMAVLLNGTSSSSGRYGYSRYGYHYGYGYGYGYGYADKD